MKILLIHPQIRTSEPPMHPPYGLLQLSAITDALGFKISLLDNNCFRLPIDAVRQTIKEDEYDIVGISGLITQFKFIKELLPVCREEHPDALIVGGGGFLSSMPFEMMKWLSQLDIGAIGEAYLTWQEIMEHAEDRNWKKVKGLIYREGKKLRMTPMRPLIPEEKLDEEVPFPAYEFSPVETYLMYSQMPYSPESMSPNCRRLDVLASYGCPFRCNFCFHNGVTPFCQSQIYGKEVKGKPFRQHSPQYVINLITHLRMTYCVNFISFIDENMATNRKWFLEFCDKMEESGLATLIKWGMVCHSRTVDAELLTKAKDVGASYISFGGETSNEDLLKQIGKGQTKEQMTAALTATQAAGINPIMSFIIGLPNTTIDHLINDAQYFLDNQIYVNPFFCFPPKTSIVANPSIKNIEDIKIGDLVLTHNGHYCKVNHIFQRDYYGKLVHIKAGDLPNPMTPNHPVYAIKRGKRYIDLRDGLAYSDVRFDELDSPKWIQAEKIERGDLIVQPIDRTVEDIQMIRLPFTKKTRESKHLLNYEQIPCNTDLMRLIGYYLAEGNLFKNTWGLAGVVFTFNSKETEYIDDVRTISETLLGHKCRQYRTKLSTIQTCTFFAAFARWLKAEFNEYAREKRLSHWIMHLPLQKQKELIKGYWRGDGSLDKLGFQISSANLTLLRQFKMILLRFNIFASISKCRTTYRLRVQGSSLENMANLLGVDHPYIKQRKQSLRRVIFTANDVSIPVRKVWFEPYAGLVHNFGVDKDESYTVLGLGAVHNCQPYPSTQLYKQYKDKIIEQHMTEEEKEFLSNPTPETCVKVFKDDSVVPSKSQLQKNLLSLKDKVKDVALQRWILSLDDATKLSVNLTDFNDVELAGLRYMLNTWDIERLKQFKKQKEGKASG